MNKLAVTLAVALMAAQSPLWAQAPNAKKELVQKILVLQQPIIEGMARQLAQEPAMTMMQQAETALQQRVAPDKREAVAKDIQADMKKYVDETVPVVRERAVKLAPSTIGALLEEKFTEDELKQVIALLESPVNKKYQSMGGDMQRVLGEKLIAETRPVVEPKIQALQRSVARRLGLDQQAQPAPSAGPAPKASAPAKK